MLLLGSIGGTYGDKSKCKGKYARIFIHDTDDTDNAISAGDVVRFAPGEKHWHGAAPDRLFAHLAMSENGDAVIVTEIGRDGTWGLPPAAGTAALLEAGGTLPIPTVASPAAPSGCRSCICHPNPNAPSGVSILPDRSISTDHP